MSRPYRPRGHWEDTILPMAADIVRSYDTRVTLRQVFYRLVAGGMIRNTRSEYNQLSDRTATARREGWFPELADFTRTIERLSAFESPAEAIEGLAGWYHVDRTEGQPYNLVLVVEKATLVAQIRSWFGNLGVPIFALRGYSSESHERAVANDIDDDPRPCVILYAGDLDPSGEDLQRNFEVQLGDRGVEFKLIRVALDLGQVNELGLPEGFGKPSDTRAAGFVRKYGRLFQVEVEALEPATLRALFQDAITDLWDDEVYRAALAREHADRDAIHAAARHVNSG